MAQGCAVAVCLGLSACCATPYQPQGFRGGYRDSQVAPGVYRVDVAGNGYTDLGRLQWYALKRGRELCRDDGYPHAYLADGRASSKSDVTYHTTTGMAGTVTYATTVTRYGISAYAVCMTEEEFTANEKATWEQQARMRQEFLRATPPAATEDPPPPPLPREWLQDADPPPPPR